MEWRTIEEFPMYEVSENGDVRRIKTGRILRPVSDRGYHLYRLSRGRESPAVRVHTLVLKAFVGPKPFVGAEACHNDGKRSHNHYRNLRWDTHLANMADMIAHGTRAAHPRRPPSQPGMGAQLAVQLRSKVRLMLSHGLKQRDVAARVGLSKSEVGRIALRK